MTNKPRPRISLLRFPMLAVCTGLVWCFGAGGAYVSAADQDTDETRGGPIHIIKDCSGYTGQPGAYCTIVQSNVSVIPAGSIVHYTQAFGLLNPAWLDSNVVLDAGNGNKAVGRCTVDFSIATPGVCVFSDGTGELAGFIARVDVSTSPTPPADFRWDGFFRFKSH
jgi:hypothetical protein